MTLDFARTLYLVNPLTCTFYENGPQRGPYPTEEVIRSLEQCKQSLCQGRIYLPLHKIESLAHFTKLFCSYVEKIEQKGRETTSPTLLSIVRSYSLFSTSSTSQLQYLCSEFTKLQIEAEKNALKDIPKLKKNISTSLCQAAKIIGQASSALHKNESFKEFKQLFFDAIDTTLDSSDKGQSILYALQADSSFSWLIRYIARNPSCSVLNTLEGELQFYRSTTAEIPEENITSLRILLNCKKSISSNLSNQPQALLWNMTCHFFNHDHQSIEELFAKLPDTIGCEYIDLILETLLGLQLPDQGNFLLHCLDIFFCHTKMNWIQKLLLKPISSQFCDFLLSAAKHSQSSNLPAVVLRAVQIHDARNKIDTKTALHLANLIETDFLCRLTFSSLCIEKQLPTLAYTVIVGMQGTTYILINDSSILCSQGSSKTVNVCLHLPSNRQLPAYYAAYATIPVAGMAEGRLYTALSGTKGIWPLLDVCYTTTTYIMMDLADGDLYKLIEQNRQLSISQLVQLFEDTISGLSHIHEKNLVHNDVKLMNILYKFCDEEVLQTGFIDFGTTQETLFMSCPGYYGSIHPTAPELWGETQFSGDVQKVEVWALGYTLYLLLFGHAPVWHDLLYETYSRKNEVTIAKKKQFERGIEQEITKPLQTLMNKPERTPFEKLLVIVYKMLALDPEERASLNDCLLELNLIKTKSLPIQLRA